MNGTATNSPPRPTKSPYAQDNKDRPVVAAENEVVDVADDVALVIDDRPQLEFLGAVALGDFLGLDQVTRATSWAEAAAGPTAPRAPPARAMAE